MTPGSYRPLKELSFQMTIIQMPTPSRVKVYQVREKHSSVHAQNGDRDCFQFALKEVELGKGTMRRRGR